MKQYTPTERFLIELSKKRPERRLINLDLEEYFSEYPLSDENQKKIQEMLGEANIDEETTTQIQLFYMALQPVHLKAYIDEVWLELGKMIEAYKELTGKKAAPENYEERPQNFSNLAPGIYINDHYEEVSILFKPKWFKTDRDDIKLVLNGLAYNGDISGYDIDYLYCGHIWLFFNPIWQDAKSRRHAIDEVVKTLRECQVFTEEDN